MTDIDLLIELHSLGASDHAISRCLRHRSQTWVSVKRKALGLEVNAGAYGWAQKQGVRGGKRWEDETPIRIREERNGEASVHREKELRILLPGRAGGEECQATEAQPERDEEA